MLIIRENRGFTLVELLVVIAIIGLLASIVVVALGGARASARDTKRKADITTIQTALELYYDVNNQYPSEAWCDASIGSCGAGCPCSPLEDSWSSSSGIYVGLVGGGFMADLPIDPINNSSYYYYYEPNCGSQGNCTGTCCEYWLRVTLEGGGTFCRGPIC